MKSKSRSPFTLDSTGWPAKVRLYARWETARKEVSGWSLPLLVTVPKVLADGHTFRWGTGSHAPSSRPSPPWGRRWPEAG